ncbi:acyltransferase family protein [Nocardioides sp. Bht2]|uniref:acyltransferase family protein n=1 Tax=Nocardioides sp. Bht2 TaxID=3392297 RepID=UPI0039B3BF45
MSEHSAGPRNDFRPDIQGLRAIAVLLVVVYHLWPNRLSGGFVGVDVFFVVSGYLITRHLAEDVERQGRVRLLRFWARRARRLLPASLMVLVVSLAAAWAWLPQTVWERTAEQVGASALYVLNWKLAADAVDYSALNAEATVAQHYWSLSVEEQFYLAWPLLIAALLLIGRLVAGRNNALPVRRLIGAGLALTVVASLWWSIQQTAQDQAVAYFVTPTRVWEFALGGLLGLIWHRYLVPEKLGPVLAWLGLVAIGWSALVFDGASAFPGWIALVPVLGTVAVLAGGASSAPWGPRWLTWRPSVFVGTISYSTYLWHWPLIVVAPYALDRPMSSTIGVGILVASLLLAWLTTRFIEDPLRLGPLLRPTGASLGLAAVAMAVVIAASSALVALIPDDGPAIALPSTTSSCVGPGALDPANGCDSVLGGKPRPGPVQVAKQNKDVAYPGCQASFAGSELVSCDLGAAPEEATRTVALVGDSHATSWMPALDTLGKKHGWIVRTYTKSSCPPTLAQRSVEGETDKTAQPDCAKWIRKVSDAIVDDPQVSMVFAASYSTAYTFAAPENEPMEDPAVDGYAALWQRWLDADRRVAAFGDVPRTNGGVVPSCLIETDDAMDCAVPVRRAMPKNRAITKAAELMATKGVAPILLRDQFCDDQWCYPVVGSVIVYRDYSHLSREYATALVPFIEDRLPVAITAVGRPAAPTN